MKTDSNCFAAFFARRAFAVAAAPGRAARSAPFGIADECRVRRSSDDLDIGLKRARGLDRLQDRDDVARTDAQRVQAVDQVLQADAFAAARPSCCPCRRRPGSACAARPVVVPSAEGHGWLTSGVSLTLMVRLPCAMATVEMRTSEPITMTPDCSSMTTFAGSSGSTFSCSMSVRRPTTPFLIGGGHIRCTVAGSVDGGDVVAEIGVDRGRDALGRRQIRIVQRQIQMCSGSARARSRFRVRRWRRWRCVPPSARRASRWRRRPVPRSRRSRPGPAPARRFRRRRRTAASPASVPPCRLLASPSALTETSMRVPCAAKAGRLAVTITAATFLVCMVSPRVLTPRRSSMVGQALLGERRVAQRVAGAVQADDEAVADQHVVADAFDVDEVLDRRKGEGLERARAPITARKQHSERLIVRV